MHDGKSPYLSQFVKKHRAEGEAKGMAEGKAEGEAKGKASSVVAVLEARSLHVPEAVRARILACGDAAVLDGWLRRAATVGSASEVFGEQEARD